jgi:hypothetical protein
MKQSTHRLLHAEDVEPASCGNFSYMLVLLDGINEALQALSVFEVSSYSYVLS